MADYNNIPIGSAQTPFQIGVYTLTLSPNEGRAQNATGGPNLGGPNSVNSIACTFDATKQCCNYTATIGGNLMSREFSIQ